MGKKKQAESSNHPLAGVDFTTDDGDDDDAEDRANADLIAAAPELYEALKRLRNEASGFLSLATKESHGNTNIAVLQRVIAEADAALAKARGESR